MEKELALDDKPPSIKKSRKRKSPCVPKTTTISTITSKRTNRLFVKIEDPNEENINSSKNKKAVINLIEDDKKTKMRIQRSRLNYDPSKEISEHKNLLTDQGADIILDIIRHSCTNHNTFIACAFATGILSLGPCNNRIELGRVFRNNGARNKANGLYIFPLFMGNARSGHWFLNVVWWSDNSGKGWTIDSLQNNITEEKTESESYLETSIT